ncbi:hypothetical protein TREMEDRAFT_42152 [Tremella mesenterica DSM 1558]|uniref:uncharacterized protein n=1 Tax=Tremella mesenterica (strain ATCC 24925 / CBS 8224 / DSM 1558 / NBRC 9311 / NRRL Y-6157 / RJB 2259-6 / UBC 559-6) TaxID=578456 RepID=UPI0003F4A4FD|nr:uncharacterized protein TREMEDRAFT_42152 [Tremella mesenterica DSM 1558]EIW73036.1 hypothetical protein TREMEDRAFT_42152 [Tremella mesenterica DSM 1558]
MPPRKPNVSKQEPKPKADVVDETPLQAVILADSYNRRFEVLCHDTPRILLPLCSTPLLTWTLEALSLSRVKQVFVFCGVHSDQIREYVANSPYRFTMDIQCLSSTTTMSAGDALRELDDMHVLNADNPFILVHSPLVSNYDISKMVEAHKKRREVDKNFIMTMGVGRGGRRHPESPIMLVHPPSSRLLHYAPHPLSPRQPRITFPASLFLDPFPTDIDTYEIWSGTSSSSRSPGYRDLGVDICEADVPALCTENFDYHDLRRHFVNGVLTSDLLGKKIAVHLAGDEEDCGENRYIERIRDTRTFGDITQDVLRRWSFPLVPDLNEPGGVQYELRAGNVYIAKDNVVLSRTTTLNGPLLIGPRSLLAHNTLITQSTLGADCSIGPNTTISHSYVFEDVRIGANCSLTQCMIGRDVHISDRVKIGRGALIGHGVRLGKDVQIPEFARVGRVPYTRDDDPDAEDDISPSLGGDSLGYIWPQEEEEADEDSDDDGEDPYEHPKNKRLLQLGRSLSNFSTSEDSISTLSKASSPSQSPLSMASSLSGLDLPSLHLDDGPPEAFFTEARASLARAYEEEHSVENARLELRTLVMGYNAGVDRARVEVINFLLSKIDIKGGAMATLQSATKIWDRWGKVLEGLTPDPTNVILDMQAHCINHEDYMPVFGILLRAVYETDIVSEEDLVEWRSLSSARGEGAKDEDEKKKWVEVFVKGKAYVDVLEQMDSEDEDEDDEEDEE